MPVCTLDDAELDMQHVMSPAVQISGVLSSCGAGFRRHPSRATPWSAAFMQRTPLAALLPPLVCSRYTCINRSSGNSTSGTPFT
jgi:hypothetical protein